MPGSSSCIGLVVGELGSDDVTTLARAYCHLSGYELVECDGLGSVGQFFDALMKG